LDFDDSHEDIPSHDENLHRIGSHTSILPIFLVLSDKSWRVELISGTICIEIHWITHLAPTVAATNLAVAHVIGGGCLCRTPGP
jgi:hypothetical protein